ncbi:hypothetical protein V6N11_057958 [Hibiscus sabdariffa]|uniref:DM2 domain-containing protein n=2 Tax=Hibiscus sabdariffa TaxID=183260 RepID=A0ABR2ATF2_9ROSI
MMMMARSKLFGRHSGLLEAAKVSSASFASSSAGNGNGLNRVLPVSPQLGKFLGASEASRTGTIKKVWEYIKRHNLQNPANKKEIICDEKLKTIFDGKDTVGMFESCSVTVSDVWTFPTVKHCRSSSKFGVEKGDGWQKVLVEWRIGDINDGIWLGDLISWGSGLLSLQRLWLFQLFDGKDSQITLVLFHFSEHSEKFGKIWSINFSSSMCLNPLKALAFLSFVHFGWGCINIYEFMVLWSFIFELAVGDGGCNGYCSSFDLIIWDDQSCFMIVKCKGFPEKDEATTTWKSKAMSITFGSDLNQMKTSSFLIIDLVDNDPKDSIDPLLAITNHDAEESRFLDSEIQGILPDKVNDMVDFLQKSCTSDKITAGNKVNFGKSLQLDSKKLADFVSLNADMCMKEIMTGALMAMDLSISKKWKRWEDPKFDFSSSKNQEL